MAPAYWAACCACLVRGSPSHLVCLTNYTLEELHWPPPTLTSHPLPPPNRSLEAAIFLFSRVARIPEGSLVLPAVCTEERLTLGAELADGTVIRGQNDISHPSQEGELQRRG